MYKPYHNYFCVCVCMYKLYHVYFCVCACMYNLYDVDCVRACMYKLYEAYLFTLVRVISYMMVISVCVYAREKLNDVCVVCS